MFVADTGNHRIQKFTADGDYITQWAGKGSDAGAFNNPRGIAIDSNDHVYVADTDNHCIKKFSNY